MGYVRPLSYSSTSCIDVHSVVDYSQRIFSVPAANTGASLMYLQAAPSTNNNTHWAVTARYQRRTGQGTTNIETAASAAFAYACSTVAPSTLTSNTSSFSVHESPGRWAHDLDIAKIGSFGTWVG
jgi:hypothetical protein